jgi:hypothetical protein
MGDKLTKQEQGFVEDLVRTGNATEAVKNNFDTIKTDGSARVKGTRLLTNDNIKNAIQTLADRIPDDKLHEVMMEGLEAGKITEKGIDPDYAVRHKYLDTALKMKGAYETDENKSINILMPVLVKFLDKKDDSTSNNGDTE